MILKAISAIAVALAGGFIAATYLGWLRSTAGLELSHERFFAVKAEIERTADSFIVLGDSIVEGALLPSTICGHAVVNAGVTGAAVEYFQRHADELLGTARPALIILAVGINDASADRAKRFRSNYEATVANLARRAPVAVATITSVRNGSAASAYDSKLVPRLNGVIATIPQVKTVIDVTTPLSDKNLTADGIHLSAEGYALWTKAIVDGVSAAFGCVPSK
jgi:lysophospholipase L1-like esterase